MSWRIRPTKTWSVPEAVSGIGNVFVARSSIRLRPGLGEQFPGHPFGEGLGKGEIMDSPPEPRMCGVPYGTVDVDRLLATLTLVETAPGRYEVGVLEKGVSALESLLFAKYQMYRNVYWHHAVRSATCMFKRAVRGAVARGSVTVAGIAEATDDGLMEQLITRDGNALAAAIRARRLHKRALDLPASDVPTEAEPWVSEDADLLELVEDALAGEVGLAPGDLLLDYPARSSMLGVDLPLRTRSGAVERLTDAGRAGQLGLPRVADELYRSARRLRVFVRDTPRVSLQGIPALLACPAAEVRRRLDHGSPLLERRLTR